MESVTILTAGSWRAARFSNNVRMFWKYGRDRSGSLS
jgi:hypothetical protein